MAFEMTPSVALLKGDMAVIQQGFTGHILDIISWSKTIIAFSLEFENDTTMLEKLTTALKAAQAISAKMFSGPFSQALGTLIDQALRNTALLTEVASILDEILSPNTPPVVNFHLDNHQSAINATADRFSIDPTQLTNLLQMVLMIFQLFFKVKPAPAA